MQDIQSCLFAAYTLPFDKIEHCVETIHEMIFELNVLQFVKKLFYTIFLQWVINGSEEQIENNSLQTALQSNDIGELDNFHMDRQF